MFKIPKYIVIFLSYCSICFFSCQQQEKTVVKTVPVVKKKLLQKRLKQAYKKQLTLLIKQMLSRF